MKIIGNNLNNNDNKEFNPYSVNQEDIIFITLIQNRITGYGQIPYTVPTNLIIDVIKSSAKWFYNWYPMSLSNAFYAIKTSDMSEKTGHYEFINRQITIDKRIKNILRVWETKPRWARDDDFNAFEIQSTIAGGYIAVNGSGIDNNLFLIENAVKMVEISAMKQMFKTSISYRFNPYDHNFILRKNPSTDTIVMECKVCIKLSSLYEDSYFERHVIANVKKELKRIIGGHTINLPGGATLNVDEICNNIDDANEIETLIKGMNGLGDIISQRV